MCERNSLVDRRPEFGRIVGMRSNQTDVLMAKVPVSASLRQNAAASVETRSEGADYGSALCPLSGLRGPNSNAKSVGSI